MIGKFALQPPCVMGVINLSRHSFYQSLPNYADALKKARQMVVEGAAIIDVGAVATNPKINIDSDIPSLQAELDLLIPFIEKLSNQVEVIISVDTYRADVMAEAVRAGAHIINDQHGLSEERALITAIKLNVPVCLMHYFNPMRLPNSTSHSELVAQIKNELQENITRCLQAGMRQENIIIDPGFGGGHFGMNADENFYLLAHLSEITQLEFPILIGLSRKSMFADIQIAVEDRLPASISAATIAAMCGAAIVRTHDVKATVDAMRVVKKINLAIL